jgi:chromosome segregation ATPase
LDVDQQPLDIQQGGAAVLNEVDTANLVVNMLRGKRRQLESNANDLEQRIESATQRVRTMETESERTKGELARLTAAQAQAEASMEQLRREKNESAVEVAQLNVEVNSAQAAILELTQKQQANAAELTRRTEEVRRLQQAITENRTAFDRVSANESVLLAFANAMMDRYKQKTTACAALKEALQQTAGSGEQADVIAFIVRYMPTAAECVCLNNAVLLNLFRTQPAAIVLGLEQVSNVGSEIAQAYVKLVQDGLEVASKMQQSASSS